MKELQLKYGCNPNQKPSKIYMADGSELPIQVLSGRPGYINSDIYTMCVCRGRINMEIKELRESTGMNRKEFCEYFEIPYRIVTEWERGTRKMPGFLF